MTRFADLAVHTCPHCDAPMLRPRLASINNYGATTWSDGFKSTIGFAQDHDLAVCPSCEGMFWLNDAPQVGCIHREPETMEWSALRRMVGYFNKEDASLLVKEREWRALPDSWHCAGEIQKPRGRELLWAVDHGLGDTPERARKLRTKLWWASKHPERGSLHTNPMTPEQTHRNLVALMELTRSLPVESATLLIQAELLRQLQCFDDALAILNSSELANDPLATIIADNARLKNTKVCKVSSWSIAD